jgi:hypothetical protein
VRRFFSTADRWLPILIAAAILAAAAASSRVIQLTASYENDASSAILLVDNIGAVTAVVRSATARRGASPLRERGRLQALQVA